MLQRELIEKDNFDSLIILDALRFDIFQQLYQKYLPSGRLLKVKAGISWVNVFPIRFRNSVLFTANPHASLNRFDKKFDLWRTNWNTSLGTVPPWEVNREVLNYEGKERKFIVYLQPHGPWIGRVKLFRSSSENRGLGQDVSLREEFKKNPVELYTSNLRLVLKYLAALLESLEGRIVVTTDHGECLGEEGKYLHTPMWDHPIIKNVPWLEVDL